MHFVHFAWLFVVCVFCSQLFPSRFLLPQSRDGQALFICVYRTEYLTTTPSTTCGILSWKCFFLVQANGIFASNLVEIDLAKIALSCHFALDLLCYKESKLAPIALLWFGCLGNRENPALVRPICTMSCQKTCDRISMPW